MLVRLELTKLYAASTTAATTACSKIAGELAHRRRFAGWSDGAGDEAVAYFLAAMVLEPVL